MIKSFSGFAKTALAAAIFLGATASHAAVIDFEPGTGVEFAGAWADDEGFVVINFLAVNGNPAEVSGGKFRAPTNSTIAIASLDFASSFNLSGFELSDITGPLIIRVGNAEKILAEFDVNVPLGGSFVFNESFSSITAVGISGIGVNTTFSLDNIKVSPVPEPSTYVLSLLGAVTLGAWTRRRSAGRGIRCD